jgi:probable F420-dependent oxidoreductase
MSTDIKLGFFGANVGGMASPACGEVAAFAESLGYASLWTGEHVVLPRPRTDRPPLEPDWPMAEPLLTLSFIAARTTTIELCTGVLLATQRQPVRLAKEAATLDVLSGGRFVLGLGTGHIPLEFEVLGVPTEHKRARLRECLDALQVLWNDEAPEYSGEFVSFSGVDAYPRPVTPGGPRIVMGGYAEAALDDAATRAHGWYGWGLTPEECLEFVPRLRARVAEAGRDPERFEVSLTPRARLTTDLVDEYRRAGVDQLVVTVEAPDADGVRRRLEYNAPKRLGVDT